jgi:hypothetical protein
MSKTSLRQAAGLFAATLSFSPAVAQEPVIDVHLQRRLAERPEIRPVSHGSRRSRRARRHVTSSASSKRDSANASCSAPIR